MDSVCTNKECQRLDAINLSLGMGMERSVRTFLSKMILNATQISALGATFQSLRSVKGHWTGGDYAPSIDDFDGELKSTMDALSAALGPGTSMSTLVSTLGKPDETVMPDRVSLMPGPVITGQGYQQPKEDGVIQLRYNWRGGLGYMWFDVDSSEKVVDQGFYMQLVV